MTAVYAAFPESILPLPQADYSAKFQTNTVTTTFTSGRARRRRMGLGKYQAAKLVWQLSPEEYDYFMWWWEHVLQLGTEQFTITMATGGLLGQHVCLLVDDPEPSLSGYFWRVAVDALVYSKPELSTEQAQLIEGMGRADALADFPAAEDVLDQVTNVSLPSYL